MNVLPRHQPHQERAVSAQDPLMADPGRVGARRSGIRPGSNPLAFFSGVLHSGGMTIPAPFLDQEAPSSSSEDRSGTGPRPLSCAALSSLRKDPSSRGDDSDSARKDLGARKTTEQELPEQLQASVQEEAGRSGRPHKGIRCKPSRIPTGWPWEGHDLLLRCGSLGRPANGRRTPSDRRSSGAPA